MFVYLVMSYGFYHEIHRHFSPPFCIGRFLCFFQAPKKQIKEIHIEIWWDSYWRLLKRQEGNSEKIARRRSCRILRVHGRNPIRPTRFGWEVWSDQTKFGCWIFTGKIWVMVSETTLEDEHVQVMMDKWEDEDNLLDLNEKSDKTTFIVYIKVEGVWVYRFYGEKLTTFQTLFLALNAVGPIATIFWRIGVDIPILHTTSFQKPLVVVQLTPKSSSTSWR